MTRAELISCCCHTASMCGFRASLGDLLPEDGQEDDDHSLYLKEKMFGLERSLGTLG